jgi:hypothetical protein
MSKEFIPYEQALELKELGFNELCLFYYTDNEALRIYHQSEIYDDLVGAPLYQQVFRWFREYYGLNGYVGGKSTKHYWQIESFREEDGVLNKSPYWHYTDAQLDCFKKLIEIAKNDTNRRNI